MATATVAALEQKGMVNGGGFRGRGRGRPFGNRRGIEQVLEKEISVHIVGRKDIREMNARNVRGYNRL